MKSGYKSFVVDIPVDDHEAMDRFQEGMNAHAEATNNHVSDLRLQLGISENCAMDVYYLRTRSRWTQAAENELIRMDKAGEPRPNINDWPAPGQFGSKSFDMDAIMRDVIGSDK